MKKFLAFLLSLTMVFAMAAVAFAEGETYQRRAPLVGQLGEPARKK